jgi:hypothetical protein
MASAKNGYLTNYKTGDVIRPATREERRLSKSAAKRDGGAGVIVVGGVHCFVI